MLYAATGREEPVKRKLLKDVERYDSIRAAQAKKKRAENCDRLNASMSLLDLSDIGNGTVSCEPHTGLYTMTYLSMADVDKLEKECHELRNANKQLRKECTQLVEEKQKLIAECESLNECKRLKQECKQLKESNQCLTNALDSQSLTEQSLQDNNTKVKYYTGLPSFMTLMAVFTFVASSMESNSRTALHVILSTVLDGIDKASTEFRGSGPCIQIWNQSVNCVKIFQEMG